VRETEFFADLRAAIKRHSGEELDIKPFEADMRHLINTYIQADPAEALGALGELSLTELIIHTGIHDAIARKLNAKGQLSKNSVAEAIVNNVRKTIIRDQLTDPRFYAEIAQLLDDLIAQKRAGTVSYEEFLQRAEALAKRLGHKHPSEGVPTVLHGKPEAIVLFNNLPRVLGLDGVHEGEESETDQKERAALALALDRAVRENAPAAWKGDDAREKQVLNTLFPLLGRDRAATQAIFAIIKQQPGY
jgi:type I restriction enzyme R subunit